jgi:hypothetical protein
MKILLTICLLLFGSVQLLAQKASDTPKNKSSLPESLLNLDLNRSYNLGNSTIAANFLVKTVIGSKNNGIIVGFQSCGFESSTELNYTPKNIKNQFVLNNPDAYNIQADYLYSSPLTLNNDGSSKKGMAIRLGYQKSIFRGLYANLSADICRIKTDVVHTYLVSYTYDYISWDETVYTYSSSTYRSEQEAQRTILGWRLNTGLGYTISLGKAKRFYLNTEMVYSVIDKSKSSQGKLSLLGGIGFRLGTPAKTSYDGIKNVTTIPIEQ